MLGGCPDAQDFVDFGEGQLRDARLAAFEAHISACPDCAQLLVELALQLPVSAEAIYTEDPAPAEKTRSLSRYTLSRILGAGGMGVVWEASDPALGRAVAIKVLRPDLGSSAQDNQRRSRRLMAEARALAALSHPNILTVFDVGEDDGHVWIATALLEGASLRGWCAGKPWMAVLNVLTTIGDALWVAHSGGVIHGDIKPDNVIMCQSGRAVITDFGLARRAGDISGDHGGTVAYMAPELMTGGAHSAGSDQFAFCAMAVELLSGAHPFERSDRMATIGAIQAGEARIARGELPDGLWAALERGLRVAPADRFEGMEALVAALRAAAQPAAAPQGRPARRRGFLFAAGALALVAASAAALQQRPAALQQRPAAPAPHEIEARPDVDAAITPASWALRVAWRSAVASLDEASPAPQPPKAAPRRAAGEPRAVKWPSAAESAQVVRAVTDARLGEDPEFLTLMEHRFFIDCNIELGSERLCRAALDRFDHEVGVYGGAFGYIESIAPGERARAERLIRGFTQTVISVLVRWGRCEEALKRHHLAFELQGLLMSATAKERPLRLDRAHREQLFRSQHPTCAGAAPE
jgi:serine/threonine-protein kinase